MTAWTSGPLLAFDIESTGPDPEAARIVTADVCQVGGDGTFDADGWLADPGVEIPAEATAVHGVTTEHARTNGMPVDEVVLLVANALEWAWQDGTPVVAFNASYDLTVLDRELRRHHGLTLEITGPVLDPYVIDRGVDRYRRGKRKLGLVCAHYGISLEKAHTSAADAEAAGVLMRAIAAAYPAEVGDRSLRDLWTAQRHWHRQWAEGFEQYLAREGNHERIDRSWPVREWVEQDGGLFAEPAVTSNGGGLL